MPFEGGGNTPRMERYIPLEFDHDERIGLESRTTSGVANVLKGPFILHNFLVVNARKLKNENKLESPNFTRIFPSGGSKSIVGDLVAFVMWLVIVAYTILTIPLGCYCSNLINVANAIVLSTILITLSTMGFIIHRNIRRFKNMCCLIKVSQDKCMGAQNRFVCLRGDDIHECEYLNGNQKQKIFSHLQKNDRSSVTIMLSSRSYWRSRVLYPSICLAIVCTVCLVGILVQLEFIAKHMGYRE